MERIKPEKIPLIRIGGIITGAEGNKWFSFDFRPKNRDFRKELKKLRPRYQILKNEPFNSFKETVKGAHVHLAYLTWESAKGLYKNPKYNLPYEVLDVNGSLIYRQSIKEQKGKIFERLEKAAIEEDLRD